jgi:hypothetical protein
MPATSRSNRATKEAANAASAPPEKITPTKGQPLPVRVSALRDALLDAIEHEVQTGNVRVILWLADKLRVLEAASTDKKPAEELRSFFAELDSDDLREFASLASKAS